MNQQNLQRANRLTYSQSSGHGCFVYCRDEMADCSRARCGVQETRNSVKSLALLIQVDLRG